MGLGPTWRKVSREPNRVGTLRVYFSQKFLLDRKIYKIQKCSLFLQCLKKNSFSFHASTGKLYFPGPLTTPAKFRAALSTLMWFVGASSFFPSYLCRETHVNYATHFPQKRTKMYTHVTESLKMS